MSGLICELRYYTILITLNFRWNMRTLQWWLTIVIICHQSFYIIKITIDIALSLQWEAFIFSSLSILYFLCLHALISNVLSFPFTWFSEWCIFQINSCFIYLTTQGRSDKYVRVTAINVMYYNWALLNFLCNLFY